MVIPQYKLHQHRDSLGHHYDHWEWGGEVTLPLVSTVGFGRPLWSVDLKDFLDKLVF
jgi:hypothetical protein